MTTIQRIIFGAGAWQPRGGAAVMPIIATVPGRTARLVPDLARELAARLSFLTYADNCIPTDAAPHGTVSPDARIVGGLVVSLDGSQPAPEYEDGSAKPAIADVRLLLTQPTSGDSVALDMLIDRREAIEDVLGALTGAIGGPSPPRPAPTPQPPPPPPRAFSSAYGR